MNENKEPEALTVQQLDKLPPGAVVDAGLAELPVLERDRFVLQVNGYWSGCKQHLEEFHPSDLLSPVLVTDAPIQPAPAKPLPTTPGERFWASYDGDELCWWFVRKRENWQGVFYAAQNMGSNEAFAGIHSRSTKAQRLRLVPREAAAARQQETSGYYSAGDRLDRWVEPRDRSTVRDKAGWLWTRVDARWHLGGATSNKGVTYDVLVVEYGPLTFVEYGPTEATP